MNLTESSSPNTPLSESDNMKPGWLFVLPWSLRLVAGGGVNEVVKALIHEFRTDGKFSPQLLVSSDGPEAGPMTGRELIKPFLLNLWSPINHEHPLRGLVSFLYRLPYRCWALRRILARHNIRVINPHFPGIEYLVFVIMKKLRLFNGKIILSLHGGDVQSVLAAPNVDKKLWKILFHGADHIVVVSNDLGSKISALDPTIAPKMKVIYNGVDVNLFAPKASRLNERPLVPKDRPMILSLGAFMNRKGHDVLIKAFSRVAIEIPDVHLLIAGQNGPELKNIRELVDALSLEKRVSLSVDVPHDRIPSLLAQARLFVLASRWESFGLVITEAAAAKVPVVCTRAEGVRELIADGVTGRLVDLNDHVALAQSIVDVLRHPDDAERMATTFQEQVISEMTWRHTYRGYLDLLELAGFLTDH